MKNNPKSILIIDDEPDIVRLLEKWLNVAGRKTAAAFSGEEGIKHAREDGPDLILLDIMLPDIGGVDVARTLQNDPATASIPIVFMTACLGVEQDKGDETIDVDGKIYRAFAKPLHNPKLLSEIRKAINRQENQNPPLGK